MVSMGQDGVKLADSEATVPGAPTRGGGGLRTGILFVLASGFTFAMLDTAAKYLSGELHVMQVVWGRYVFSLALLPWIVGRLNPIPIARTGNLKLQVVRSLLLLAATIFFFTAIRFMPLADATAIAFVSPLLLTVLSIPLLGERVGLRRWAAVAVGLAGALIIIRPGLGVASWATLLPLATAFTYSLYQIGTRKLTQIDATATIFLYTGVVGALVMSALVPFFWSTPSPIAWLLMATTGLLGGLGHYLIIQAFVRAPASALAPFSFVTIIWTTCSGYLVFGDLPDAATISGAAIIIASGIFVFYRESVAGRAVNGG